MTSEEGTVDEDTSMEIILSKSVFGISRQKAKFFLFITLKPDSLIYPQGLYKGLEVTFVVVQNVIPALNDVLSASVCEKRKNALK